MATGAGRLTTVTHRDTHPERREDAEQGAESAALDGGLWEEMCLCLEGGISEMVGKFCVGENGVVGEIVSQAPSRA